MLAAAQVRAHVAGLLAAMPGAPVVQAGRYHPVAEGALPVWLVYIEGDDIELTDMHYPSEEEHSLRISVDALLRDVPAIESALDAAEAAAMTALFSAQPLHQLQCIGTERLPQREGSAAVAVLRLRLLATFHTQQGDPQTIL